MSFQTSRHVTTPQILLNLLCNKIVGLEGDALSPYYQLALTLIAGNEGQSAEHVDEFVISQKIQKILVKRGNPKDALLFAELHRKLQTQGVLRNRSAILCFLWKLSNNASSSEMVQLPPTFSRGLLTGDLTSTPMVHSTSAGGLPPPSGTSSASSLPTRASSGVSSVLGTLSSVDITPRSFLPSELPTPGLGLMHHNQRSQSQSTALHQSTSLGGFPQGGNKAKGQRLNRENLSVTSAARTQSATLQSTKNTSYELAECTLVRELLYVFQGIDSKYIKYDATKDMFNVDRSVGVPQSWRTAAAKLAECGWLFSKIRKYADIRSTDRAFGLVGQSFCAALQQDLTEYYRLISILEAQLQQEDDQGISEFSTALTLRRLNVWTFEPRCRLKKLAALVDVCQGMKGGALASVVHSYLRHGDPALQALVKHLLGLVSMPIFSTIMRWIYDGVLEDTYHEFFVASEPTVKEDRLWNDKYSLRKSMIPSFISQEQADKILLTGKSINFLRQLCGDRTVIRDRDVVKMAETTQIESIFCDAMDGVFQKMIDTVYNETSCHLLEVLHSKYKFMDHLKAMRRYLLLGQGDFIRHLMNLLEDDLGRPAGTLFMHNLTGTLETAIRATNAQYDDPDILKRLDVRLLGVSPGDTGWDVFSLDYHVDGPIRTVFTPECIILYLRVFNFLWRAKRMDYVLAGIWKGQMVNARILVSLPELKPVLHQCHMISCEMVHFVQQVQYYLNFEVLECTWAELLRKVTEAEDLDHIIAAHQVFLDSIITRSLLDPQSAPILTQLRAIFDLIIQFQEIQSNMYKSANEELQARKSYQKNIRQNENEGAWGTTLEMQEKEEKRIVLFIKALSSTTRPQLKLLSQSYQNMVQQFLVMLAQHSDASLRFLSFRLDFNEHYKAREPLLQKTPIRDHNRKMGPRKGIASDTANILP